MSQAFRNLLGGNALLAVLTVATIELTPVLAGLLFAAGVVLWVVSISIGPDGETSPGTVPETGSQAAPPAAPGPDLSGPPRARRTPSVAALAGAYRGEDEAGARRGIRTPTGYPTRS